MRGLILAMMYGIAIMMAAPTPAIADGAKCNRWIRSCKITSEADGAPGDTQADRNRSATQKSDLSAARNRRLQESRKKFSAAFAKYDHQLASYTRCMRTFDPSLSKAGCGKPPTPPTAPEFGSDTFSGRGNQPSITAGQAAAIAVARLQLPTVAPGIGPSPELNPWDMAAVGYPLWLWADGPTHVGPISDAVAGLSVSLEAEVSSLTFRMGDGHTVNCPGTGHPWTTAVEPGRKSPNCGYSYAQPSLPDDTYTVAAIANWAVTWTSNGQSGVINVPAVDTTELPVGELQVLVR
ncbi:MAG TPA: hypothetical protein VFB83_09400 [Propionibacteriaceae bacterium]|nr:hypothetical protein [Propionibacteriaceae bacterium]